MFGRTPFRAIEKETDMGISRILPKAKRGAFILPLIATIVVFIFLIGIAVLKIGFGSRYIAAMTSTDIAARCAADAGRAY